MIEDIFSLTVDIDSTYPLSKKKGSSVDPDIVASTSAPATYFSPRKHEVRTNTGER